MAHHESRFRVNAPIDEVMAYLGDLHHRADWDTSAASVEVSDDSHAELLGAFYGKRIPFTVTRTMDAATRTVRFDATHANARLTEQFHCTSEGDATAVAYKGDLRLTGVMRVLNKGLDSSFVAMREKAMRKLADSLVQTRAA